MTLTNLTNLIGLKSTDEKIATWFETHNLGKPPKSVNANQEYKGIVDKKNGIIYQFYFEIKNDAFFPPVSPKKDDYTFECYLSSVLLYSGSQKKEITNNISIEFWNDFINPNSSFEECCIFFENKFREQLFEGKTIHFSFEKQIADQIKLRVYFNADKLNITGIDLKIIEDNELIGYTFLNETDPNYPVRPEHTLLVKWLFDNKYLILPDELYLQALPNNRELLLQFIKQQLKGHLWSSQVKNLPHLHRFIEFNTSDIGDIYIKSAGLWEQHQEIYYKKNDFNSHYKAEEFKNAIILDEKLAQTFLNALTEKYKQYSIIDSNRTINFKLHS